MIETVLEKSLSDIAESKEHRLALYNEHLRSIYAKKNSISRAVALRHNRKQKRDILFFTAYPFF